MKAAYEKETALWIGRLAGPGLQEAVRPPQLHIALQQALQSLGFLSKIPVAGTYTQSTRTAIAAWQAARGRAVTGLLGDDDAASLAREASLSLLFTTPPPPAATGDPAKLEPPKQPGPAPVWRAPTETKLDSTGTAFAINAQGDFLTNDHVVKDCQRVDLVITGSRQDVKVAAADERNDLAAVRASGVDRKPLRIRDGSNIRPADGVVALGFPYAGLLASTPQITTGTVSALAGLHNDTRYLQITAPVQPGSSGGPLLDLSGNLVGIVAARINALAIAEATGTFPENINFAIKSSIIRDFLDASGINYIPAPSTTKMDPADVGEAAAPSTVLVECYK